MTEKIEILDVPPVGHLAKLRAVLPKADRIIQQAREVGQHLFPDPKKKSESDPWLAPLDDVKAVAARRRVIDKLIDRYGMPRKRVHSIDDFPTGTQEVAESSG